MTEYIEVICFVAAADDYLSGNLRTISYFDFNTLRKATKNFDQGNLIGRGGFGPVYLVFFQKTFISIFISSLRENPICITLRE